MFAPKYEAGIQDEAEFLVATKGEWFQLSYPLQNNNMYYQYLVVSGFVSVFPKVLQLFIKFLLILQLFLVAHKH